MWTTRALTFITLVQVRTARRRPSPSVGQRLDRSPAAREDGQEIKADGYSFYHSPNRISLTFLKKDNKGVEYEYSLKAIVVPSLPRFRLTEATISYYPEAEENAMSLSVSYDGYIGKDDFFLRLLKTGANKEPQEVATVKGKLETALGTRNQLLGGVTWLDAA